MSLASDLTTELAKGEHAVAINNKNNDEYHCSQAMLVWTILAIMSIPATWYEYGLYSHSNNSKWAMMLFLLILAHSVIFMHICHICHIWLCCRSAAHAHNTHETRLLWVCSSIHM